MSKEKKKLKKADKRLVYFTKALNLANINCGDKIAETILTIADKIDEKGGKFSIKDSVAIQLKIEKKYNQKGGK
jgi:hypothetical protein